jgi:hypothetical protein
VASALFDPPEQPAMPAAATASISSGIIRLRRTAFPVALAEPASAPRAMTHAPRTSLIGNRVQQPVTVLPSIVCAAERQDRPARACRAQSMRAATARTIRTRRPATGPNQRTAWTLTDLIPCRSNIGVTWSVSATVQDPGSGTLSMVRSRRVAHEADVASVSMCAVRSPQDFATSGPESKGRAGVGALDRPTQFRALQAWVTGSILPGSLLEESSMAGSG